jgi:hypothetical protein
VYKPLLEEILNDIIVMTEIAELGCEADNLPDDGEALNIKELVDLSLKKRSQLSTVRWSSVRFKTAPTRADSDVSDVLDQMDGSSVEDSLSQEKTAKDTEIPMKQAVRQHSSRRSSSAGLIRIKNLLDRWEEPINKLDKVRVGISCSPSSSTFRLLMFRCTGK